ncbi:MAG: TCR/Tet family MFS transporter [Myxococcota bacterium]
MNREPGRHALAFVFITVLIDMIGFGIVIPVVPELIMELTGEDLPQAAVYGGWLLFLFALMQFFMAPVIGNLSDRFGRRPILLLSLAAYGLDYALMGLAPTLAWLFVGRLVAGIVGGSYVTANAYIADVSAPEDRAKNFGLVGAAFGLGFILGPVIGGLLGEYGARLPFFVAAGMAVANVVYGFVVLPETLPASERRPFSLARANPVGAIGQVRRYPVAFGLLGVYLLYMIAHDANPSVFNYYTMLKFGWGEREVGLALGLVGVMITLVQGVLIRVVIPWLGEVRSVYAGYLLLSAGFLGFAFAGNGWVMLLCIVPWSLGEIATPALRGIMANQVPDNAQGELQGALTSVASLTAIGAPILLTRLFHHFTADPGGLYFPGAAFFAAGAMVLGALSVFAWVTGLRTQRAPAA